MSETVIGVLADTHIPDRSRKLHPQIAPIFEDAGVELILHAGDISRPRVLRELAAIAPVQAVRGNRDLFLSPQLPTSLVIERKGKKIGMTHGHGSFGQYLHDKISFMLGRYKGFDYFAARVLTMLPEDVDIVIFGHNHAPMQKWAAGKLVFNPGSACCHIHQNESPSIGLIRVSANNISSQIITLKS